MERPVRRFRFLLADEQSVYGVLPSGEILWYRPAMDSVTSGQQIGIGWADFRTVFAGGDGILYAVTREGALLWYRDELRDGTNAPDGSAGWAAYSGSQIHSGWGDFTHAFYGGDGIIYAVKPTGELLWYRDLLRDGSNAPDGSTGWDVLSGNPIGAGWNEFRHIVSGGQGVIYAVRQNGELAWYRDVFRNGANDPAGATGWDPLSGAGIDTDWDFATHLFSGADGILFACQPREFGGQVWQFVDNLRDGLNRPVRVGSDTDGWQVAAIEGYGWPLGGSAGDQLTFHVSSMIPGESRASFVRLTGRGPRIGDPVLDGPAFPSDFEPNTSWSEDCAWPASFDLSIPEEWSPGFYAARLRSPAGAGFDVPFIVKKSQPAGQIALLVNVDTWNAYNTWGGASNYTGQGPVRLTFKRPNHHLLAGRQDHRLGNHLLRGEIWLFDWLREQGYAVDLYTDVDLHAGIEQFSGYKALVLSTHPEYWTPQMMANVSAYLDAGRCVLYLGGNAMYRPTALAPSILDGELDAMETDATQWDDGDYPLYEGRPLLAANVGAVRTPVSEDGLLPAMGRGVTISAPLHRFFDTVDGAAPGVTVGLTGWNGNEESFFGASGWEVDYWESLPEDVSEVARDTGQDGAVIACYETSAGGFVLGAASLTFVGSLMQDTVLQDMVRRALDEALAKA